MQHRDVVLDDFPHNGVINRGVLMGQLIAEVNDPARVRDALEGVWRSAIEGC